MTSPHAQAVQAIYRAWGRGDAAAAGYFGAVTDLRIHEFKVLDLLAGERQVAVEVEIDFTVPATGVRRREQGLHLWTFGADGQVVRMRRYVGGA